MPATQAPILWVWIVPWWFLLLHVCLCDWVVGEYVKPVIWAVLRTFSYIVIIVFSGYSVICQLHWQTCILQAAVCFSCCFMLLFKWVLFALVCQALQRFSVVFAEVCWCPEGLGACRIQPREVTGVDLQCCPLLCAFSWKTPDVYKPPGNTE